MQNFVKLEFPEFAFPENRPFERFWTFQTHIFGFRASIWHLTSGKTFMVIGPVVSEILGGWYHPPDAIALSKRADAINR